MDSRNIKQNYAVMCIESKYCRPVFLTLFLIFLAALTIGIGCLTIMLPKKFEYLYESTWKCDLPTDSFNPEICHGVDIFHDPFATISGSADPDKVKYNLMLSLRPKSAAKEIGLNFQMPMHINLLHPNGNYINDTRNLTFNCNPRGDCGEIMLFQFHQIKYSFFIEVANKTFAKEVQEFIGDAELVWRNDNPKYEGIACIFRYVGLGITLILLIVFWVQTGRQQYKTSAEQRWIMYFMIATIVMDNPLFGFILIYRGGVFSIIDNILNVIGVCFLMLYPLVALGGFITTKMTCRGFFFPRCILILVYGAMLLVVNIYQTIKSIKYPTTTLRDVPGYFVFNFIAIFLYIIWLIWFLYNLIRVFVVTKQHPRAIKGRYRAVICFVVLFSLGFHVLVTIESFDFSIFSGINPVAKVWVANCFCWMMAIVFMPTRAERMTSTTIEGAMHPKQRNVRESIVRSAIEEVTVDDEGEPVVYREQINEIGPGGREGKEKKSPTGTEANEREKVIELEPDFGENDPTANI